MSTTIDQRVVEMRFDNKDFESNVQTTMSTLEKFKQKLNLSGASKGLENINVAAKNVDMTGLGTAVESVGLKFSAMQVMGVTALANLTNSAVNAGKRIVSALTIEPVKTGFQEYETQINAVQTILANTSSKGSTIEDVNKALDELNAYADKTIYNFTEMTRNIGTFTAAGVDLDTSVNAIQGIANLAAVSGSTSQQASTAMYQLSQALAAGTVKLMDWNSVVNAGMGGQVFQDALKKTSEELKTGAEAAIKAKGSFRESLQTGWLTSEVLTETLKKFTTSGANEYVAEYTGLSQEAVSAALKEAEARYGEADAIEYASKALAEKSGKNAEEIKSALQFAKTAEDAATKVKTFTQLWDVLKESAQSGWTQTWEILIGDFEEAKSLFTPLADFLTGVINNMSEARNALLQSALSKNFKKLAEQISGVLDPVKNTVDTVKGALLEYDELVDQIIRGDWGNGQSRWDELTKAGYDWAHAQNLVNEKLGDSTRHATDYKEAQDKVVKSTGELTEEQAKLIEELVSKSDLELKSMGYTSEQIAALRELEKVSNKLGLSISDLLANIDEIDGRWLLLNSFKNIGQSIVKIFKAIGDAWKDAFSMKADTLFNVIAGLHKFSTYLKMSDDTADKLTRTLKGVFAILDIVLTIVGGPVTIAFTILSQILAAFDLNILDVTAAIGDVIVGFRNWIEEHNIVTKAVEKAVPIIKEFGRRIAWLVKSFIELSGIQDTVEKVTKNISDAFKYWTDLIESLADKVSSGSMTIGEAFETFGKAVYDAISKIPLVKIVAEWVKAFAETPGVKKFFDSFIEGFAELKANVKDAVEIGRNMIEGLVQGLKDGSIKPVEAIIEVGKKILEAIKEVLGIHSPSTEFFEIGKNIIEGLLNGLQNGVSKVLEFFKNLGKDIVALVNKIDWRALFAGGVSIAMVFAIKKLASAFDVLASPLEGLGDLFGSAANLIDKSTKGVKKVLKSFSNVMNSFAFSIKTKALKNIAISLAILVASVIALTLVDTKKLWNAVGVVLALSVILGILASAVSNMSDSSIHIGKKSVKVDSIKANLLSMAAAILLLGVTVKLVGSMDWKQGVQGFAGLTLMMGAMVGFLAIYGTVVKGKSAQNLDKLGGMMLKLSVALLLMIGVVKLASKLEWSEMGKGAAFAAGFAAFVLALTAISKLGGKKIDSLGGMMLKLSVAMLLMIGVVKLVSKLSPDEMKKGAIFAAGFTAFVWALVSVTKSKTGENEILKVGGVIMAVSTAMLIMSGVIKIIAGMEWGELAKGAVGVVLFGAIIAGIIKMVKTVGPDAPKLAGTLIAMSVAIGIMAGVAVVLSLISIPGLAKGIIAVGMLSAILSGMIVATRGANECKGNIIAMSVAIGVMAVAVAALSMIDGTKLAGATLALSTVMGMFALMTKMAGTLQKGMGSLITITVAVGLIGTMLYILAKLPVESTLGVAASLSALLLSMSVAMSILNKPSFATPMSLVTVGILTLVVAALGGILYLLKDLPVQSTLANATALSALLLAMSGCCLILSAVGATGPAAFIGVAALVTLIASVGGLIIAIGALAEHFPKMEEFLNKGIPILEKIGYGLGSFFGNIVGGLMDGITSGLPGMATNLSLFMTNLQSFIEGAKTIDESALTGVTSLVKMIALIAGANFIESISSFLTGESSMDTFATQLNTFGDAIVKFSQKVAGNINEESVLAAANAGKLLAEMQTMVAGTGGVVQWFCGEKNLETFGTQLLAFGSAIVGFSQKVSGNINEEAVTAAANAGTLMAEMQSKIVPAGGVVQWFTGEKDMATFGTQLVAFGEAIVSFSNKVKEGVNEEAVTAAATAGRIMMEMQSKIVPTGGVVQWFCGEKNLATFGSQLVAFGEAITGFSQKVSGNINEEAVTAAANAGKVMVTLQKSIPEDKWLDGKVSLDDFGKKIKKFGEYIKSYSEKVAGIDAGAISASTTAAKQIINITKSLNGLDPDGIDNFKAKTLGKAIKAYADKVSGMDAGAISSSIVSIKRLVSLINSMAGLDTSGVASFKSAISSLSKTNLDGIAESFSSSASTLSKIGSNMIDTLSNGMRSRQSSLNTTAINLVNIVYKQISSKMSTFQKAGVAVITKFASGINSGKSKVSTAIKSPISSAITGIRSYYSKFYNAGSYLVSGFAAGISANSYKAAAKARAMANAAEKAAREALDINSPSKVFRKIGYSVPEGFAQGIERLSGVVTAATGSMATSGINSLKDTVSRIGDMVNGDLDVQPRIRPVLDLSNVKSGVGTINGLLGQDATIGALANVNSISSMMNGYNQNGANDDVVSAIDKLRKELGNVGGTTYQVNGVTYDDGSNIAGAVKSIVRAAKIERRR